MDKNTEKLADNLRKGFGLKEQSKETDKTIAAKATKIFEFAQSSRRQVELEWFMNDHYYKGERGVQFNADSGELVIDQDELERSRITVNKSKQLVRGIVSYINRSHPGIGVAPGIQSEEAYSRSKKVKYLCDSWYTKLGQNSINKKVTLHGVRYGVGWRKILWDSQASYQTGEFKNNQGKKQQKLKGDVSDTWCNTWDVYPDPHSSTKDERRFICHAIPRTINELRNNSAYRQHAVDELAADDKKASSSFREAQLAMYGNEKSSDLGDSGMRTAIVIETYYKEYNEYNQCQIRLNVTTPSGILLRDEVWALDEDPFEDYQTDVAENIFDSVGSIKDNRSMYGAINRGASQMEETMQTMGRINWSVEKGSGLNIIEDRSGQIMERNRGYAPPEQVRPSSMPAYVDNHMASLERWADDIGGAHQAFYGKSPFSRASGEFMDKMQSGDDNNLAMMKDNMDDHQARTYKLLLKTWKHHAPTGVGRYVEKREFDPLGQHSWVKVTPEDISIDDEVTVRTGSNMPFSIPERQDMAMKMWEAKLIQDPQKILKMMDLADMDNLFGNDQLDIDRQVKENQDLVAGKEVDDPVIAEDHSVHIRVIDQLIKSPAYYELDSKFKKQILDHRQKHAKLQQQAALAAAATDMEPIKRSMNIMYNPKSMNEVTPIERTSMLGKMGVESDQAEIQVRGGLRVQDPMEAQQQAADENSLMMDGDLPKVSLMDNHKVHMMVHELLMRSQAWEILSESHKGRISEHVKNHQMAYASQAPTPGLMPDSDTGILTPDHTVRSAEDKAAQREQEERAAESLMPEEVLDPTSDTPFDEMSDEIDPAMLEAEV